MDEQSDQEQVSPEEQRILDRLGEIQGEVGHWVQQSEARLDELENQCADLAEQVKAQAKQAHEQHGMVGLWTRQMYGRITQLEHMVKSLAVSLAQGRVPVRMPPQPTKARKDGSGGGPSGKAG